MPTIFNDRGDKHTEQLTSGKFWLWLLAAAAAIIAWELLARWDPLQDPAWTVCFWSRLQVSCPGCGLTRALLYLAKGQWSTALMLHPLAPFLALEGFLIWAGWSLILSGRARCPAPFWINHFLALHLLAFSTLWLYRALSGTLP